jgi:hypothetical protein
MKSDVFWDVVPCRSYKNRRFEGRTSNNFPAGVFVLPWRWRLTRSSEMSVLTRSTRHHIPEGGILHNHRLENFQSETVVCFLLPLSKTKNSSNCAKIYAGFIVHMIELSAHLPVSWQQLPPAATAPTCARTSENQKRIPAWGTCDDWADRSYVCPYQPISFSVRVPQAWLVHQWIVCHQILRRFKPELLIFTAVHISGADRSGRSLRHELCLASRTLGIQWVLMLLETWKYLCVCSVFV